MAEKNGNAKKKRLELFNNMEKIALIQAVQGEPILWDMNDKKHFDAVHIKSAWGNIATLLNRNAAECKVAWKSLRDSYRYHCKASEKRNTEEVDWHLAPHLKFLPDLWSHKRNDSPPEDGASSSRDRDSDPLEQPAMNDVKTDLSFSNLFDNLEDSQLDNISCDGSVNSFQKVTPCIAKKAKEPAKSQDIISMLGSFLSKHSDLMDQTATESTPVPPIRPIFEYWERILKKMDKEKADAAERAMTDVLWQHENPTANGMHFKGKEEVETSHHDGANDEQPNSNYSSRPQKRKREEKELTLSRFQRELFRCKNQRAQEMHDFEMHRERTKLDQEVEEGKLRIEMIRLELMEKRDKLNLKGSQ